MGGTQRSQVIIGKEDRYEIRLSGSGGQGIITASIILAEAAGVYDGKYACQTQSYGPEVRGGVSKAEVVISKKVIDYPRVIKPSLLLAMDQASCDRYFSDIRRDGLLVVDSTLVTQIPTMRSVAIPFTQIARKELGQGLVTNIVALGAVCWLCQVVSIRGLEAAVSAKFPQKTRKINQQALLAGIKAAKQFDLKALPSTITPEEEDEV